MRTGAIQHKVEAMGAAVARVEEMMGEDRMVTLESDIKRVFSDIGEIKGSVKFLEVKVEVLDGKVQVLDRKVEATGDNIDGVRIELHSFETEVAKEFGAVREQIGGLRTEMIEKIGNLRIWVLITIAGSVASLVSMGMSIASFVRGWKSP
jgi:predicted RNase H-like nuclease (RuvC/YqgF family)